MSILLLSQVELCNITLFILMFEITCLPFTAHIWSRRGFEISFYLCLKKTPHPYRNSFYLLALQILGNAYCQGDTMKLLFHSLPLSKENKIACIQENIYTVCVCVEACVHMCTHILLLYVFSSVSSEPLKI